MEHGSDDVVVVMAREPVPGAVKTRLAAAVGADAACALYRAWLADIARRFSGAAWRLCWAVTPPGTDLAPIVGSPCAQLPQRGDTLGARMAACFADLFAAGSRRVVMVGADAPHLDPATLADAFAVLAGVDAVLVPTRDGGYCAVGLRTPADVFSAVPMGGPDACARTVAALDAAGHSWHALPATFDVDELADVRELAALIDSGAVELPHTARVLAEWRAAGLVTF